MVGSLNKVMIIGNVGRDPEIRSTQDGREIANFSLATTESWKDKNSGERKENTTWHRVVIFSQPLVNIVKNYVKKGSKLYIEGSLQSRKWTDANNVERTVVEIVLQSYSSVLILLDSRGSGGSGSHSSDFGSNDSTSSDFDSAPINDEVPF